VEGTSEGEEEDLENHDGDGREHLKDIAEINGDSKRSQEVTFTCMDFVAHLKRHLNNKTNISPLPLASLHRR
jgi:hypothetical protein